MACDICGKVGESLEMLNSEYQTKNIQNICSECARDVNEHLWKIRAMNMTILQKFVVRFMEERKSKKG
jgi:diphthamide synthase (EF-2-diphthine--ammonia ligase)